MQLKINHNADEEIRRISNYKNLVKKVELKAMEETLELARKRILGNLIISDGGEKMGGKKGSWFMYKSVAGATLKRRSSKGKIHGKAIFHKSKVASRSGEYEDQFELGSPELMMKSYYQGKTLIGSFGLNASGQKDIKNKVLEFGSYKSKKRSPIRKGLKFAAKRFDTILLNLVKPLEHKFNTGVLK